MAAPPRLPPPPPNTFFLYCSCVAFCLSLWGPYHPWSVWGGMEDGEEDEASLEDGVLCVYVCVCKARASNGMLSGCSNSLHN